MSEHISRMAASKLDGYLLGITSFSGGIRDYTGSCFVAPVEAGVSISDTIRSYFTWLEALEFAEVLELPGGLRDLEVEVRPFVIRDARGLSPDEVLDLQHYVSFRVMDMVWEVLAGAVCTQVFRLDVDSEQGSSEVTFFAVVAEGEVLVLQFNNEIPFKRMVQAGGGE